MIVFDIETAPRLDIEDLIPEIELPPMLGEFDPNSVKVGNLKDPEKIKAKVMAAKEDHEKRLASETEDRARLVDSHRQAFIDEAPLSAAYGRVLAIGMYAPDSDKFVCLAGDDEVEILTTWWGKVNACIKVNRSMIGLNSHEFDLPFLIRRSWILGVEIPPMVVHGILDKWPKFHQIFIDVRKVWLMGCHPATAKSSYDCLAAAFGTGGKTEESGKYFWKLWQEDRTRALAYLEQDVRQPAMWFTRMVS